MGDALAASSSAASDGEAGEQVGAQEMQDAGDGDEDGDALAADEVGHAGGVELIGEVDFGGEEGGDPEAHELAEDVAEGQGVEEAQGMEAAFVAAIFGDLVFDGLEADEDVAVGVDDALGLGGGAGGEDDLEGGVEGDGGTDGEVRVAAGRCASRCGEG